MATKLTSLHPSIEERTAAGKALRDRVSRKSQGQWKPAAKRPDPIELLKRADEGRLPELLPIRYGRMSQSPFAFFRGAAALMAFDLSSTPATGLRVQACGDCHIGNFGGFGSPERRLVFDINDFDETSPAPWEWDVKRLATSVVLAARQNKFRARRCRDAARHAVKSYREHIRKYARMRAIDAWYSHLEASILVREAKTAVEKKLWQEIEKKAKRQTATQLLPQITYVHNGNRRIVDHPPLVYHPRDYTKKRKLVADMFHRYLHTLPEDRKVLLQRYQVVDIARKVVGVGSVGTRCAVMLLLASDNDPLFLQFKEAFPSVLEPYASKSKYSNYGERVVTGQRMLQSASDVFLGWTHDDDNRCYYFRQLRDMKMKIDISAMSQDDFKEYIELCGWALARGHARTGDPVKIGGYLGKSDSFDDAIEKFAVEYADQTEQDYGLLKKAIRTGRLPARTDEPHVTSQIQRQ
jgi:uncharacterized protein (DUF2252 family)